MTLPGQMQIFFKMLFAISINKRLLAGTDILSAGSLLIYQRFSVHLNNPNSSQAQPHIPHGELLYDLSSRIYTDAEARRPRRTRLQLYHMLKRNKSQFFSDLVARRFL